MTRLLSLRTGACQLKCAVHRSTQSLNASSGNATTIGKLNTSFHYRRHDSLMQGRMHRQSCRLQSSSSTRSSNMNNREKGITAIQMNLDLNKIPNNEKAAPSLSELASWILQKVKVPKGE